MQRKETRFVVSILIILFILMMVFMMNKENFTKKDNEQDNKSTDIRSKLPYTLQVYEGDKKPEIIAYRILFDVMRDLESEGSIANASYTRFTKLSGDDESFVVAVVFQVQLPEGQQMDLDNNWGKVEGDGMVRDIVWKLTIQKVENLTYSLTNIEKSTDLLIGLPPVEDMEDYQKEAGIEVPPEQFEYELKDEVLRVTYDKGQSWQVVPVTMEDLFGGDFNDSENQLIDGSYVITPERTAFVLGGYNELRVLISTDQGESWNQVLVSNRLPVVRMRLLGFTSEQDGYLIVTGDRTMSSEANMVFKTNDGGQSWNDVGLVDDTYSLVSDGGFIDDQLGFISFGEYRFEEQPPRPNLYRTTDGGTTWEHVEIPIPKEYQGYFTVAEIPTFNGSEGTLIVNQGSEGDYLGGKVLTKFNSQDQGETWSFVGLIDPNGVLGK